MSSNATISTCSSLYSCRVDALNDVTGVGLLAVAAMCMAVVASVLVLIGMVNTPGLSRIANKQLAMEILRKAQDEDAVFTTAQVGSLEDLATVMCFPKLMFATVFMRIFASLFNIAFTCAILFQSHSDGAYSSECVSGYLDFNDCSNWKQSAISALPSQTEWCSGTWTIHSDSSGFYDICFVFLLFNGQFYIGSYGNIQELLFGSSVFYMCSWVSNTGYMLVLYASSDPYPLCQLSYANNWPQTLSILLLLLFLALLFIFVSQSQKYESFKVFEPLPSGDWKIKPRLREFLELWRPYMAHWDHHKEDALGYTLYLAGWKKFPRSASAADFAIPDVESQVPDVLNGQLKNRAVQMMPESSAE